MDNENSNQVSNAVFRPCSEMLRRGGIGQGLSEPRGYLLHKTWDLCKIWFVKTPNLPWWDIYFPAYKDQASYQVRTPYQRVKTTSDKIIPQRPQTTRRTTWRVEGARRWLSSRGPSARTLRLTPAFNQGPAPLTAGVIRTSTRSPPYEISLEIPQLDQALPDLSQLLMDSQKSRILSSPANSFARNQRLDESFKILPILPIPKLIATCHTPA